MLKYLRKKGEDTEQNLNQKIPLDGIGNSQDMTLFDLCLKRKYRSGLLFLINTC